MKKVKVGVIGVGQIGKEHARILASAEKAELIGVADIDPAKRDRARELNTRFLLDYRELIPQLEAVTIAVPTSLHYSMAKDCLEQGLHVLVEKPITTTVEEADEILALAAERKRLLRVGHIERHNAAFRAIEKVARNIRFMEIHRLGPFAPRIDDCGVVLDLMIHDLDIVLSLVRSEIDSMDAVGVSVLTRFEDIANARIRFKNGCVANLTASRVTPERQRKIRIFQEDAYISLDYVSQSAQIFTKDGNSIQRREIDIQKEESLRNELEEFLTCIQTEEGIDQPDVGARDALELALEIVAEIQKQPVSPRSSSPL